MEDDGRPDKHKYINCSADGLLEEDEPESEDIEEMIEYLDGLNSNSKATDIFATKNLAMALFLSAMVLTITWSQIKNKSSFTI